MNILIVITAVVWLMLSSCQQRMALNDQEKKVIEDSVHQTLDRYNHAIRESGLNAEFAFLDSSEDFFWVPPGYSTALPYDSVVAIIRSNARAFTAVDNKFSSLSIHPLSTLLCNYTAVIRS